MLIVHGDNPVLIHSKLAEIITNAKNKNQTIVRLEVKNLTEAALQEALGSDSLFGETKTLIIEELHSLPPSTRKKKLIEQITQADANPNSTTAIVLFEKKKLTATMLKKLASLTSAPSQIFEFKISNSLWKFLDFLGQNDQTKTLNLLHQAVSQNDEHFVFVMICRQIRMLIETKDGGNLKGAPFMISKLKSQANKFSLSQLLKLHAQCFQIDFKQKTSASALTLAQELDLLIIKL